MKSLTRISKPFGKVILGIDTHGFLIDTHGFLEESAIYEILKIDDELILTKVGNTTIHEPKGKLHGYSIEQLALNGRHLFTDEELDKINNIDDN